MTKQLLLEIITKLKVWKQRGQRAPHKPLLLLLALSRIQHNKERLVLFSEIEKDFTEKLIEFGPQRKSYYPEEPFCRLRTDGLWELTTKQDFQIPPAGSIRKTILRKEQVKGGLTQDIYNLLNQQASATTKKKKRDPKFRGRILQAYNYCCAICGFDVRLGNTPIALEAAHIMWHQAGGPDTENNGLALCSLHHKLLDRGALAISNEFKVIISEKANGYIGFQEWLLDFEGKELRMPQKAVYMLDIGFMEWHVREVFQGEYLL